MGAVSKIKFFSDNGNNNLFVSVGQKDGALVAHDMRTHAPIFKKQVHRAAINFLDISD